MEKLIEWIKGIFPTEKSGSDTVNDALEGLNSTLEALAEGVEKISQEALEVTKKKEDEIARFKAREAALTIEIKELHTNKASAEKVHGNLHKILNGVV